MPQRPEARPSHRTTTSTKSSARSNGPMGKSKTSKLFWLETTWPMHKATRFTSMLRTSKARAVIQLWISKVTIHHLKSLASLVHLTNKTMCWHSAGLNRPTLAPPLWFPTLSSKNCWRDKPKPCQMLLWSFRVVRSLPLLLCPTLRLPQLINLRSLLPMPNSRAQPPLNS